MAKLEIVSENDAPLLFSDELLAEMAPQPVPQRAAAPPKREAPTKEAMMALQAVASLLTVRLALVLAVIGAFVLALVVVQHESLVGLYALGIFSLVVGCLSWLAQKRVS